MRKPTLSSLLPFVFLKDRTAPLMVNVQYWVAGLKYLYQTHHNQVPDCLPEPSMNALTKTISWNVVKTKDRPCLAFSDKFSSHPEILTRRSLLLPRLASGNSSPYPSKQAPDIKARICTITPRDRQAREAPARTCRFPVHPHRPGSSIFSFFPLQTPSGVSLAQSRLKQHPEEGLEKRHSLCQGNSSSSAPSCSGRWLWYSWGQASGHGAVSPGLEGLCGHLGLYWLQAEEKKKVKNQDFRGQVELKGLCPVSTPLGTALTLPMGQIVCLVEAPVDCGFAVQKPYFSVCRICYYKAFRTVPCDPFSIRDQSISWKLQRKKHAWPESW